jgi:hypothetical protein
MAGLRELLLEAALFSKEWRKARDENKVREAAKLKNDLELIFQDIKIKAAQQELNLAKKKAETLDRETRGKAAMAMAVSRGLSPEEAVAAYSQELMPTAQQVQQPRTTAQQIEQMTPSQLESDFQRQYFPEERVQGPMTQLDRSLRQQTPLRVAEPSRTPAIAQVAAGQVPQAAPTVQPQLPATATETRRRVPTEQGRIPAAALQKPAPRPVTKATPPPVTTAVAPTAKVVEPSQPRSYQQMVEDQLKQLTKEAPVGPPADLNYPSSQELFVQDYINKLTGFKLYKTPTQQRKEIEDKAEQYTKWRKGETDHLQSVLTMTKLAKDLDAPIEPDYISHGGSLWVTTPEGIQEIIPGPDMKFIKTVEDISGTMMAMYEDWSTGFLKVVYAPVTQLIEKELGKPGKELKVKVPGKKEYKIIGGKSYLFEDGKKPVMVEEWPEPIDPVDQSAIDQHNFDNTQKLSQQWNANPRKKNIGILMNQFGYMHTAMEAIDQITDEKIQVMSPDMTREQREKIAQKVKYITAGSEDKWEAAGITSPNPMIQTILVTFQKILDPTSVVRESEYARSVAGVSALRRIEGAIQNFIKGGAVSVSEVKDIYLLAEKFYQNARLSHSKNTLPFLKRAARNPGIRVDEIFALDIYDLYGLKYNASKKEIMNFIDQIDTGEVDLKTLILSTNPYDKRAEIDTITPSEGVPSSVITPQEEKQNKLEKFGFTGRKKKKKDGKGGNK